MSALQFLVSIWLIGTAISTAIVLTAIYFSPKDEDYD